MSARPSSSSWSRVRRARQSSYCLASQAFAAAADSCAYWSIQEDSAAAARNTRLARANVGRAHGLPSPMIDRGSTNLLLAAHGAAARGFLHTLFQFLQRARKKMVRRFDPY